MPYTYLGVTRDAGTSKKTNNKYDILVVHFAQDASQNQRPDRQFSCGLEPQQMPISEACMKQFQTIEPLTAVNFDFEPDPRNMQRNRICGVRPVGTPKPSAAA